jgi:mRNA interferase MazF
MPKPQPREVWQVDLGLSAKSRSCLIMSDYPSPDELALLLVIPHTTAIRGNRWEFSCQKPFLKPGVFHLQQIQMALRTTLVNRPPRANPQMRADRCGCGEPGFSEIRTLLQANIERRTSTSEL